MVEISLQPVFVSQVHSVYFKISHLWNTLLSFNSGSTQHLEDVFKPIVTVFQFIGEILGSKAIFTFILQFSFLLFFFFPIPRCSPTPTPHTLVDIRVRCSRRLGFLALTIIVD